MKKHDISITLKIGLLAFSLALSAVCIYEIVTSESNIRFVGIVIIVAALLFDGYLLFCTKGIYMDESNKQYRDKVYIKNKPSFIPSGEKFLEVAAIDDIVSKATSVIDRKNAPEHELCPVCGKKVVREQTVLFYTTKAREESENWYWVDRFGNFVGKASEVKQHINQNDNAVQIKCTDCEFGMTVGWGERTREDYDGNFVQMPTKFVRITGVKLCQASNTKLEKELKRADGIELTP